MRFASRRRFIRSSVPTTSLCLCLTALALSSGGPLHAQGTTPSVPSQAPSTPVLKSSPMLAEKLPQGPGNEVPTFVFGERLSGRLNLDTTIDGRVELRHGGTVLRADHVEYNQTDTRVRSRGNVRISSAGNQFAGPELELRLDTFEGFFTQPRFRFLSGGNGQASRVDFIDSKHLVAHQASYTTCERDNEASWKPAWELHGDRFDFDFNEESGRVTGATLRFKDVPILGWPGTVSFPLTDKRKSGLLPPTYILDTTSGFSLTAPYYFDVAPNRDATVTPTYMTKRGIDLGTELRYLEPAYRGTLRTNYQRLLDIRRLGTMLARIKGRIIHKPLDRVSPLAVPVMLEIGREPVSGEASESLLAEAADELVKEAMG